jgi:hypothetical protein
VRQRPRRLASGEPRRRGGPWRRPGRRQGLPPAPPRPRSPGSRPGRGCPAWDERRLRAARPDPPTSTTARAARTDRCGRSPAPGWRRGAPVSARASSRAGMLDRGADLEAVQDTHGARPQQDAGADLVQRRGPLDHDDADAALSQGDGRAQPPDAGADDDDLPRSGQRSHLLESTMEVAAPLSRTLHAGRGPRIGEATSHRRRCGRRPGLRGSAQARTSGR